MSIFTIIPYVGFNNIKFNDSQKQVEEVDGAATRIVIDNIMEETYEHRKASIKLTFVEERLADVWIPQKPADNKVYLKEDADYDIFSDQIMERLKGKYEFTESKDKNRVLFPELGICLWGFGKKKTKEGKMVIAFSKERLSWYKTFLIA